jgi:hypothetical protein
LQLQKFQLGRNQLVQQADQLCLSEASSGPSTQKESQVLGYDASTQLAAEMHQPAILYQPRSFLPSRLKVDFPRW